MREPRTVPLPVAAAWMHLVGHPAVRPEDLAPFGRQLGNRAELDLAALAAAGHGDLAADLAAWEQQCRDLWGRYHNGSQLGAWVALRRVVRDVTQQDNADGKTDLSGELAALTGLPGWGDLITAATAAAPDPATVDRLAATLGAAVERHDTLTVVTWADTTDSLWDEFLGGAPGPGEFTRWFTVTVRHAAWRDRRTRRLTGVRVDAEELWPDPRSE